MVERYALWANTVEFNTDLWSQASDGGGTGGYLGRQYLTSVAFMVLVYLRVAPICYRLQQALHWP